MTDMQGLLPPGLHTVPSAGSYIGKVVATAPGTLFGADGRSVDAANISFTTTIDDQQVVFLLDSYTGRMHIEPAASGAGPGARLVILMAGPPIVTPCMMTYKW
jgi:hypothetical protein